MAAGYDDLSEGSHILQYEANKFMTSLVISPLIGRNYYTYSGCETLHKGRHIALCMDGPVPKK